MKQTNLAQNKAFSSRGISLIGVMVSIAILSGLFLTAAYVMAQMKSVETKSEFRTNLDRSQLLTIQRTRSAKFLRNSLGVDPTLPGANTALINCLKGRGTACRTTASIPQDFIELPASREETPCPGAGCRMASFAQYKAVCASDSTCQSVRVKVQTQVTMPGSNSGDFVKPRETIFAFPAMLLIGAKDMNFDCAQTQSMIGLDFATRAALCSNAAVATCGANRPMTGMGPSGCPDLESVACPNGTASLGLFRSQSTCL